MVYMIDSDTYQLVAANKRIKERFPEYCKGMKCYKLLHKINEPCENCGIKEALKTNTEVNIVKELVEQKNGYRSNLTHREQEIPHFYKWGMNCD